MSMYTRSAAAAGLLFAVVGSANAGMFNQNIFIGFQDPFGGRELIYTQPATAAELGSLTYDTSRTTVDLTIDLSDFGFGSSLVIVSRLQLDVDVGPASPGAQPNEFVATASGNFSFFRDSDGASLISGTFNNASLSILRGTSGGLTANGLINAGQFNIAFNPALLQEFSNFGYQFAGFDTNRPGDASWTVTAPTPNPIDAMYTPQGSAENFFASFTANSAFTGTIPVIPTPGVLSLAAAAGLLILGSRRR
ncbi:MAG: hypothetical protein SFZ24_05175 [Planctomycetota bacterium]|nr:hypothetical protein [Planctomycetota bacterium]